MGWLVEGSGCVVDDDDEICLLTSQAALTLTAGGVATFNTPEMHGSTQPNLLGRVPRQIYFRASALEGQVIRPRLVLDPRTREYDKISVIIALSPPGQITPLYHATTKHNSMRLTLAPCCFKVY